MKFAGPIRRISTPDRRRFVSKNWSGVETDKLSNKIEALEVIDKLVRVIRIPCEEVKWQAVRIRSKNCSA